MQGASKKASERWTDFFVYFLLALGSLVILIPFWFLFITTMKSPMEAFIMPPDWFPKPNFVKYTEIWEKAPFLQGIFNSLKVALPIITIGTFTSSLAAFAFAKLRFPGRNFIFLMLLATIMIPFPVVMIPQFVMFSELQWIDSLKPLIIPAMLGNVIMMFFIRQFMNSISDEFIEAAKIDGASLFGIFIKIMLPMVKPAVAAQLILWFLGIWNDYLGPRLYLTTPEKKTIQLMMADFNAFYVIQSDYPLIMAAAFIVMIPILIVFLVFQRYFVESLNFTGVKG
ncbi:carbohydrate ABC transporter permease [Paenibacillus sp. sptzw28]|uniref:carbohydrate ABC transporter permease n=1 Tax=Paenibacillus sp. sptzw28 TaxID=715179 RepID=UPI001C6ECA10|nr:carbohydrate ABC transporter permease [Paenibacillus sp. sptzw28]QYR23931.1 carbohydrate ABC transporter permease [Paenibacillus sp. sptzw28]